MRLFLLMSLLDGYSFAIVQVKGIVAFKLLRNCDFDVNHRPLKHEPIKDMFILSIYLTLYENQSKDEKARTIKKSFLLTATVTLTLSLLC